MKVISLDTETTGVDVVAHGAAPFLVTTCDQEGNQRWWQWSVDPLTREVDVDPNDVDDIQAVIDDADEIALHNAKFDAHALRTVGIYLPFEKVKDTLMGSHLLASNHPHNLTDTVLEHLGVDIEPYERRVQQVVMDCRKAVKRNDWLKHGVDCRRWRLAEEGATDMPSVNGGSDRDEEKPWKNDMWLPHAVAEAILARGIDLEDAGFPAEWLNATPEYANADTAATLPLWLWMEQEIKRRDLWEVFLERMKLVPIANELERRGVTLSRRETHKLVAEYSSFVDEAQAECLAIAQQFDFELELPAGAAPNDSLREFIWGSTRLICPRCGLERKHKHWSEGPLNGQVICPKCLKKKGRRCKDGRGGWFIKDGPQEVTCVVKKNPCLALRMEYDEQTGSASLNRKVMDHYVATIDPGLALDFVTRLTSMRSRQTAITYMNSYERYWVAVDAEWYRLHGSVNPTGTDTLRWSSNNPNSQNISKKADFNLRRCFGPAPGREWWSMDGENLELRIPAYEANETDLMWVFDHPNDPPYFGSYHLVVFDVLHPELFAEHGKAVKELFESTWYQWVKNGNFAVIYGAQRRKADQTYHVKGAFDKVRDRFPKIAALNDKYKAHAEKYGYVETIPDRSLDTRRGYPILVSRSDDGRTLPTTPFNYHVSGTAMQWTNKAQIRCDEQLKEWQHDGWDGFVTLQVHDELVFDCPRGVGERPWETNLWRMDILRELMKMGGDDIGVPTPVSREWHGHSYAEGVKI